MSTLLVKMNRTSGLPDLIVQQFYILYLHTTIYIFVNIFNMLNLNMMGFFHFSQVTKEIIVLLNTYPKTLKCLCLLWVETS